MRRLSGVMLGALLLFLFGMGVTLYLRARSTPREPVSPPRDTADYRIQDIHVNETLEGDLRWRLDAEQAEVYNEEKKTLMRQVKVTVFQKDRVWVVTGDEGEMQNETRDVTVRGNVVVTSEGGLRFTSESLHWQAGPQRLWTDSPIRAVRGQTTITGRGFEVDVGSGRALIRGQVRVTIGDPKNVGLALLGGGER